MPRYFFHIHDGTAMPDLEGTELDTLDQVQTQAVQFAGRAIQDMGLAFWTSHSNWRLEVVDALGTGVLTLDFAGRLAIDWKLPAPLAVSN